MTISFYRTEAIIFSEALTDLINIENYFRFIDIKHNSHQFNKSEINIFKSNRNIEIFFRNQSVITELKHQQSIYKSIPVKFLYKNNLEKIEYSFVVKDIIRKNSFLKVLQKLKKELDSLNEKYNFLFNLCHRYIYIIK